MKGRVLLNASSEEREESDFYPTPKDVTYPLLDAMNFPQTTHFWECAAGSGAISDVLRERAYSVIETDIRGEPPVNFLLQQSAPPGVNYILTNPPFRFAQAFIETALKIPNIDGIAFLLKSQFWHAHSRLAIFRRFPPSAIMPLTWRPDFCFGERGGSPTMEVLWTVWDFSDSSHKTIYMPLERPGIQNQESLNFNAV